MGTDFMGQLAWELKVSLRREAPYGTKARAHPGPPTARDGARDRDPAAHNVCSVKTSE